MLLTIALLCCAASPAPQGRLLLLADDNFYVVPVRVDVFAADAGTVSEARFWRVTRSDVRKANGSYEAKASASLVMFPADQLRPTAKPTASDPAYLGIEAAWRAGAKTVGALSHPATPQTWGVQVPPGWTRKQVPKRLEALVKAELIENYDPEAAGEAIVKLNAELSAAFTDGQRVLWYVSSESDLRGFVTLFISKTPDAPPLKIVRYDFIAGSP